MLARMHHKIIENWISAICGTFGFGLAWTNINWADALPKIMIASFSAGLAGGMGYLGKIFTSWMVRKIKTFIRSFKNKSPQK